MLSQYGKLRFSREFWQSVVTGSGDGAVRCFDAKSGHLLRVFDGHPGSVMAMQMAGERIFTATTDGYIRVFRINWEFVK